MASASFDSGGDMQRARARTFTDLRRASGESMDVNGICRRFEANSCKKVAFAMPRNLTNFLERNRINS